MSDDLIEEVREMGEHPSRADLPMGKTLRDTAEYMEALLASNEQWQVDYNEAVLDNLQLQAENAKLRASNQAAAECVAAMMEECARYRDEIYAALQETER